MADDAIPPILPTGVAQDLGVEPSPPAPPVMSYAQATSMKQEFFANKEKMAALMAGGVEANREWQMITAGLSQQPPAPTGDREADGAHLQEATGYALPQEIIDEFVRNDPVTPEVLRGAEARWESLTRAPDFVARFNRKETDAMQKYGAYISIKSRPV
jgi:hypothetical protein